MTGRKIYLSGPMTGLPEFNYPAFEAAAFELRANGDLVFSPHEFLPPTKPSQKDLRRAFAAYARFICEDADTIVLLPGWEKSQGATAELALAKCCGLSIVEYGK